MMNRQDPFASKPTEDKPALNWHPGLLRIGVILAFTIYLASLMPGALVALAINNLLFIGAFVTLFIALLARDRPMSPHLTRWDEAAFLGLLAMLAGMFVDPVAAQTAIETLQSQAAGVTTEPVVDPVPSVVSP